ncbi:MAG TPA: 2OG-Fe(II) oxygenase [Myxococcota bacterium]|nr:2OG-Fe(II) oxygenase [Myxococcota bacterium]
MTDPGESLDELGYATMPGLVAASDCAALAARWDEDGVFRKRVVMQQHGFGRGEYRYFDYPLPSLVQALRQSLYAELAPIANRWRAQLGLPSEFPATLEAYLEKCHGAGQTRPTPLVLRYEAGDFNCLHQDLYGEQVFPLQATVLLSDPARDFTGGEFLLLEQRPRAQSRGEVVPLARGDAVIFAVRERPRRGARGFHRAQLRHGVSRIRSGLRFSLGIIFHDAAQSLTQRSRKGQAQESE